MDYQNERKRSTMFAFYEMAWSRFGALKPAWLQGHKHIKSSVSVIQSSRISNAFKLFTKPSPCSVKPDSIRVNTSLWKTERDTEKNWELYEWQTEDCSYRTPSHPCLSLSLRHALFFISLNGRHHPDHNGVGYSHWIEKSLSLRIQVAQSQILWMNGLRD